MLPVVLDMEAMILGDTTGFTPDAVIYLRWLALVVSAILAAVITTAGGIFMNRRTLRMQLHEVTAKANVSFGQILRQKRLDHFPEIYALLSDFAKSLKAIMNEAEEYGVAGYLGDDRSDVHKWLNSFLVKYELLDSRHGVYFSIETGVRAGAVRTLILTMLLKSDIKETRKSLPELKETIGDLEFMLKRDCGVIADELAISEVEKRLQKYDSVERHLEKTKAMRAKRQAYRDMLEQVRVARREGFGDAAPN
jgi:hypothetical protein